MQENITSFLARIDDLSKADRCALKREVGSMLSEVGGNALRAFYGVLPMGVPKWQESRFFAVGCLKCLYDACEDEEAQFPALVGRLIKNETLSDSAAHRAQLLLDLQWDEDGYMLTKLSQMLKLLHSKAPASRIDFESLLSDLLNWNSESQFVQRNWARAIYQNNPESTNKEGE